MNAKHGLTPLVWVIIAAVLFGGGYVAFKLVSFTEEVEKSTDSARLKAQTTKILANVKSYQNALDIYKEWNGSYPDRLERVFEDGILSFTFVFEEIKSAITYIPQSGGANYTIRVQLPDGSFSEFRSSTRPSF